MKGDYPRFKATYAHEELVEHFLLNPAERALVDTCYGDAHRHGVAVLLKSVQYLGYVPDGLRQVPEAVRTFLAHQLQLLWDHTEHYPWHSRTHDRHLALIRHATGFRFPTAQDKQELETWLRTQGALDAPTKKKSCVNVPIAVSVPWASSYRPSQNAAGLSGRPYAAFFRISERVTAQLSQEVRTALDQLLVVEPSAALSPFDQLKAEPSAPGVKNLQQEVRKLQTLRALGVPADALAVVPWKVLQTLQRRAMNERASEMRAHPTVIRYALMACFIHARPMEVTDDVVRMLLEIIRRMDTQTEKHLHKKLLRDIKHVAGRCSCCTGSPRR